ncbi:MAG: hypothetical protein ACPGJV_02810 [Bacteriovoracaceae bacterium]
MLRLIDVSSFLDFILDSKKKESLKKEVAVEKEAVKKVESKKSERYFCPTSNAMAFYEGCFIGSSDLREGFSEFDRRMDFNHQEGR